MIEMKDLFTIKKHEVLPYEYTNNAHISVRVERNPNVIRVERNIFNAFDLLSDVGGLTGILV